MARHRTARRAPKPRQPAHSTQRTHQTTHAPSVPATTRDAAGDTFGRRDTPPVHAPATVAGASPALELSAPPSSGLADVILDLAGAGHASLHQTLTAWQREQDRVLNRAWRRPGGLARPAGL